MSQTKTRTLESVNGFGRIRLECVTQSDKLKLENSAPRYMGFVFLNPLDCVNCIGTFVHERVT